jgi:hypothetical protein
MKKNLWFICLIVFVCILSSTDVWVQEKKTDYSKEVDLFIQVLSYGQAQKDPLIMISAVRMLDALPFDSITVEGSDARYERAALLNQAKEYASGDQEMLAMIDKSQEEKVAVRGHHGGHHGSYHHRPHHYSSPSYGGPGCAPIRYMDR